MKKLYSDYLVSEDNPLMYMSTKPVYYSRWSPACKDYSNDEIDSYRRKIDNIIKDMRRTSEFVGVAVDANDFKYIAFKNHDDAVYFTLSVGSEFTRVYVWRTGLLFHITTND
ncbi:hypothetical protein RVBP16_2030 [Pseudomonas phage sp. 30-2]|nr:hypothetical protein RVBP16_2030 [Pseudomonas phage sp. 30-2]